MHEGESDGHKFHTVQEENGKVWMTWNQAAHDAVFFESDDDPAPEEDR